MNSHTVISEIVTSQLRVRVRECRLRRRPRGYSAELYRHRIIDTHHLLSKLRDRCWIIHWGLMAAQGSPAFLLSYIAARGPGLPYLMPSNKHTQNFYLKFLRVFHRRLSLVFSFKTRRRVSAAHQEISSRESETLRKHNGVKVWASVIIDKAQRTLRSVSFFISLNSRASKRVTSDR